MRHSRSASSTTAISGACSLDSYEQWCRDTTACRSAERSQLSASRLPLSQCVKPRTACSASCNGMRWLRARSKTLRNHVRDFLNVEIFERLLQVAQQRCQHRGNGRDLLQILNSFQQLGGSRRRTHEAFFPARERSPLTYAVAPGRWTRRNSSVTP